MSTDKPAVPVWHWIVAVLALLWQCAGIFAFYSQVTMTPEAMAQLPAEQREIWQAMPGWVTAAYGIAVGAGFLGAVSLLLRRAWAWPLFLVSLFAVVVQFGWTFFGTRILELMPLAEAAPFPAFIFALGVLQAFYAGWAKKRGWLA